MCGICGILNIESDLEISEDIIISMRDTMISRGPDDSGIFLTPDKKLGLGAPASKYSGSLSEWETTPDK